MTGREDGKENDLFFTCSLIEYIARKTKNKRSDTVDCLGRTAIEKIYDLADVYHSDNIETVSDEFIEKYGLKELSIMFPPPNMPFRVIGILAKFING